MSSLRRRLAIRTRIRAALEPDLWLAGRRELSSRPAAAPAPLNREEVRVLARSPLFDRDWYDLVSGMGLPKEEAVRHYLTQGRLAGITPHPLFDPAHFAAQHATSIGSRDPLALYLTKRSSRKASPHPLFDVKGYLDRVPAAAEHELGPLGHYLEIGAGAGVPPNGWYVPDPAREPRGLIDWIEARATEWARIRRPPVVRKRDLRADGRPPSNAPDRPSPLPQRQTENGAPRVSVVLLAGDDPSLVPTMLESVQHQTVDDWEVLVVHDESDVELGATLRSSDDVRIRSVAAIRGDRTAALSAGLAEARGDVVAWISGGDQWDTHRLERVLAEMARPGVDAVHDLIEFESPRDERPAAPGSPAQASTRSAVWAEAIATLPEWLAVGWYPDLAALVVRRVLALAVHGFDPTVHRAAEHDFFLKVAARTLPAVIPEVGVHADVERRGRGAVVTPVRERPSLDLPSLETWHDVVLNRHLVPWEALLEREAGRDGVSVVIPTYRDWSMTTEAVRSVAEAAGSSQRTVGIVVVDNGSDVTTSVVLASLPRRFENVRILSNGINHGFALGNNLAMREVDGEFVVFLNNDTEVTAGWLEPLLDALADPAVLGAQALLLYPDGTIQSGGIAFPSCGGIPHALLQGFPRRDADGLDNARFSAVTAAALAMRRNDFLVMRGFDPLLRNGMEDVDLGLRMTHERHGHFVVRPDSVVVHHESKTPGRFATSLANRRILLERWRGRMPGDDEELWSHAGYEVVRHERGPNVSDDRRLSQPVPVLRRHPTISGIEPERPSLRWAIKNPAPNDPSAEFWGDTHFARQLAAALEGLGQQVVIDHRPAWDRASGSHDDVVLVLRGLAPYRPYFGQVNLGWLISHPEMLSRQEASSYDRLFAASTSWAEETSRIWGIRVDPLLQATDPSLFNPDRSRPDTGHPVLFVGSSRRKVRPLIRDAIAAGMPVAIFGREWQGIVPEGYVKAEYLANNEVGAAYRAAGLVLNDHWEDMRVAGFLSNRLFDAAASGARVITDDVTGLGTIFGRSVQVVRDAADLARFAMLEDLDEVFGDDAERRSVAARMHAEHSFDARARTLLDAALSIRKGLSTQPDVAPAAMSRAG